MVAPNFSSLLVFICIYIKVEGWDIAYDPDGDLPLNELVKKLNYGGIQSYYTTTKDGYIINVERIKREGSEKLMPIILVHGMSACAKSYFVNRKKSPPILFADKGYDVWLLNSRGTQKSLGHTKWNSSTDREFWMFSWQEIGLVDLPDTIDLVLQHNVHEKVILVGHSEGSTVIFVTLSDRPEYNEKVALSVHWGVSVYHEDCSTLKLITFLCRMEPVLSKVLESIGWVSLLPSYGVRYALRDLCRFTLFKETCTELIKVLLQSDDQVSHVTDWSFMINFILCGGSTRELFHYMQIGNTGRFARYDYGSTENLKIYNSTKPPFFHLENVKSAVVLWCGNNDIFCTQADIQKLTSQLTNVESSNFRGKSIFSHVDFLIAKDVKKYIFVELFEILKKYSS